MNKGKIIFILVMASVLFSCLNQPLHPLRTGTPATVALSVEPTLLTGTPTTTVLSSAGPVLLTETPRVVLATETPVPTLSPVFQPTATATRIPTPTILPTDTATAQPESRHDFQCLEVKTGQLEPGVYTGTIVLRGYEESPSYLFNLSTVDMKPLVAGKEGKSSIFEKVSPDHIWLAYEKFQEHGLVVRTVDGKKAIDIPEEEDWYGLSGWLDNRRLLITLEGGPSLVFNPFTGERRVLSNDFPYLAEPIGIGADWWGIAAYNPSLTRAVYPKVGRKIVLWDMQAQREVTSLFSAMRPFGRRPVWSPDGDEFILALQIYNSDLEPLPEELYRVSKYGQQTKITNLGSYYENVGIAGYSWSPDADQVAFWLTHPSGNNEDYVKRLAILNMETSQVTEYCINGDVYGDIEPPVWSPDGTTLVVESRDHIDINRRLVVLVDLNNGWAAQIAEDLTPVGWMVSP
jgi:hypothetical protein